MTVRLTKELTERPEPARVRLTLDIDERLRRAVKLEATRRGISVREYVTDLILCEHDPREKEASQK